MENYFFQIFSIVLNIILMYGFKSYIDRNKDSEVRQHAIEQGLRSLLRDRIIQSCLKCAKQGNVPIEELDNVNSMFEAYKDLNGNGATEAIYKRFLALPTVEVH